MIGLNPDYLLKSSLLYYEESLVSSNLNSKQLGFHCAHPNQYNVNILHISYGPVY